MKVDGAGVATGAAGLKGAVGTTVAGGGGRASAGLAALRAWISARNASLSEPERWDPAATAATITTRATRPQKRFLNFIFFVGIRCLFGFLTT
jgi:hypothetical protein